MKALKFVPPAYGIPKERKTLYTKTVGDGERLDVVAWPLNPSDGTTFPDDIEMAFESVIWNETDLDEEGITDQVMRDWMKNQTLVIWNILQWEPFGMTFYRISQGYEEMSARPTFARLSRTAALVTSAGTWWRGKSPTRWRWPNTWPVGAWVYTFRCLSVVLLLTTGLYLSVSVKTFSTMAPPYTDQSHIEGLYPLPDLCPP